MAFHPYPQLIRRLFNAHRFGPPRIVTCASPWSWIDHCGFGSTTANLFALFRLAFASAPHFLLNLAGRCNSPVHSSIGTPSTIYQSPTACRHTVSGPVSLPSRGAFHLSLTVLCAIGRQGVFCLGGWSPLLPTGFLVSRGTLDPNRLARPFAYRAFTFCGLPFQVVRLDLASFCVGPQPQLRCEMREVRGELSLEFAAQIPSLNSHFQLPASHLSTGLGSSPFARRYLGNLV